MAYDKNIDYKALMDQAAARGDYRQAARLEQQRNEKIRGEGMSYAATSDYAGWLNSSDYGEQIKSAIDSGGSKRGVASLLGSRVEKASSTKGMEQWVKDDIYDMAIDYLSRPEISVQSYSSRYESDINGLLNKLLNRQPFSYDYENDPLYQAYASAYRREGRRATQDAIGMSSQNTGGYASSYAAGAAQQAGSYYSAKQAGKLPELYQLAYEVYKDGYEADAESLGILERLDERAYQRYKDSVEELYQRDMADYQQYLNELKQQYSLEQQEYDRSRDQLADQRYDAEWQYRLERDRIEDQRAQEELKAKLYTAAPAGSGSASKKVSSGRSGASSKSKKTEAAAEEQDNGGGILDQALRLLDLGLGEVINKNRQTNYSIKKARP